MVGSAILRTLKEQGHTSFALATKKELNISDALALDHFLKAEKPDIVINAAAKVGGIYANKTYPADFIYHNLSSALTLTHACFEHKVKRYIFLGSSCIYPKYAPQPMTEECLLTSQLEPTNEAYAIAKIAGLKLCQYYRQQYGVLFHSVMPTNLYGPGDSYNLENAHVIPSLIRKIHQAKIDQKASVTLWGDGTPKREFLHVDDLAKSIITLIKNPTPPDWTNVGYGSDITIAALAECISNVIGYNGKILFDNSQPNGTPRKLLDITKIKSMGWEPKIDLKEGLTQTYQIFLKELTNGTARL